MYKQTLVDCDFNAHCKFFETSFDVHLFQIKVRLQENNVM